MDTIMKNSGISKTSDPHKLLLNLPDKISLNVALSSLSIYYAWKKSC